MRHNHNALAALLMCVTPSLPSAQAAELVAIDVAPLEGAGPQRFGTDPNQAYLPKEAVDLPRAPVIVVDPGDSDCTPLPYYQIAPDTYFFFGNIAEVDGVNRGFNANAGFVVTRDGVLVVDALGTPYLGRRMIATISSVTDKPIRYLVIMHAHPDHYYGASAFARLPGVKIISHAGTEAYVHSSTIQQSVAYRKVFLPKEMENFHAVVPDILLGGGNPARLTLKFGDKIFDIYDTGFHHSHGDLVMHQVKDKILWISDLAFNGRITYIGDGHLHEIAAMQDWMMHTFPNITLMIPGHGAPQTPPFDMVARTRRYVDALTAKMRQAIDAGKSLQDAVADSDLPEFENVPLYGLNHRINANYVYRVLEEESF
jgi:glyoxylase-like metal-dependent hydrolase (beta-lactamase superfamily II)